MFVNVAKCAIPRTAWQEIKRNITKTTSVTNSDAITSRNPETQIPNADDNIPRTLLKLNKYHRGLSTLPSSAVPVAASGTAASKEESRQFMSVFPDIVRDLTDAGRHTDIPEVTKWLSKVLHYNVPRGKKNRGLATVLSYKMLKEGEEISEDDIYKANILGWCVEMLQAFLLVYDDMMDDSEMRRGMPCWYRHSDVGINAINDGLMVENGIYSLLRRHFQEKPYYTAIMELFHDVTFKTSLGQCLDLQSIGDGKPRLNLFTMERYKAIVKYKTAYYSFQLPVALAMYMAGTSDPEMHRQSKTIMLEMGHFFQVQDDFLDVFGNPEVTGKNGTDIQDGKCSWLAVVALQRVSPKQRAIMERCYGSKDPSDIAAIKELYEDLNLPHMYSIYEEESYNLIRTHIQQMSRGMPHNLFFKLMEKIYRRDN